MFNNIFTQKSVISSSGAKQFIRTYAREHNWHNLDIATGNLGYGWIHYAFIRMLQPDRVLCVGSRYGYIPAICALACKDNKKGIVDFVDAGFDENDPTEHNHWGGVGVWKKTTVQQHFRPFGLSKYMQMHVTTTQQFAKITKRKWKYIYIDGDHSYMGAKHDFDTFWSKLLPDGAIVFHDIYVKRMQKLIFGVYKLWKEIKLSHPHNTIEIPGEFGLGILMKPKSIKWHDNPDRS